jgi:hypothetical protein
VSSRSGHPCCRPTLQNCLRASLLAQSVATYQHQLFSRPKYCGKAVSRINNKGGAADHETCSRRYAFFEPMAHPPYKTTFFSLQPPHFDTQSDTTIRTRTHSKMLQLTIYASPTRQDYIDHQLTPSPSSDEKACPICYDDWEADHELIVRTHCGHTFHRECFVAWLCKEDINGANSCPSCRAVCFPKLECQKENGLSLDMSYLHHTMRSDYVTLLPTSVGDVSRGSVADDEAMLALAFVDEDESEDAD